MSAARKLYLEPVELDELRQRLVARLETVVLAVLGEPKIRGKREWRWGRNGGSLCVVVTGDKRGQWIDRSTGNGGDLLKLIGGDRDFATTLERACNLIGYNPPSHDLRLTEEQRRARAAMAAQDRIRMAKEIAERKAEAEAKARETDAARVAVARQMVKGAARPEGTPADAYVTLTRSIPLDRWPPGLGWHPGERALIATATTKCGIVTAAQIVRLTDTGQKRPGGLVKQTYGRLITDHGRSAVRLPARKGVNRGVLCHAEGIETGLSAHSSTGFEVWIALGSIPDPQPGRLNVILADDDAPDSDRAKSLSQQRQAWDAADLWFVVALPREPARGDKSDFNDLIRSDGAQAVRDRIQLALASRPWPETTPPTVPPPPLPPTITKDDLDAYVVNPIRDFVDAAFDQAVKRMRVMIANAESHDGLTVQVPLGAQLLNAAGTSAGKTAAFIDACGERMAGPPPPGHLPWRVAVLVQNHVQAEDLERRLADAFPGIPRQIHLGADRPDPNAKGFDDPSVANKTKMCRRYDEANAVMRAGGSIETLCGSAKRGFCPFNPEHPNVSDSACGRKSTTIIDHGFLILAGPESLKKAPPASFNRTISCRVPGSDARGEKQPKRKKLKVDVADLLIVDETKYTALLGGANDDGTAYEVDLDKLTVPLTMFGHAYKPIAIDDDPTEDRIRSRNVFKAMFAVDNACNDLQDRPMRAIDVALLNEQFDWMQVRRDAYSFKPEMEDYIRPDMSGNELREALKEIGRHNAKISKIARLCLCIVRGARVEQSDRHKPSGHIRVIKSADGLHNTLRLHWVDEIHDAWRDLPTLQTDATPPDLEIMHLWRPRLNVVSRAHLEIPECAHYRQVYNSAFSYYAWSPENPHTPPGPDEPLSDRDRTCWNNIRWLLRFLSVKLNKYRGQGGDGIDVLAILPMNTELALIALWNETGGVPERLGLVHYNNMAGVNHYQRVRYQLILSRPLIPTATLEIQASTASGVINETIPDGLLPEVEDAYLLSDGTARLAKVRRHPDPMTERFRALGVTAQLVQGIGRTRAPWRTPDRPLDTDILCNEPLPLPIDDLVTKQSLWPEGSFPRWLVASGVCPVPNSKGYWSLLAVVMNTTENAVRLQSKRDPAWTGPFEQPDDWPCFTVALPGWRYAAQVRMPTETVETARAMLKAVGISNAIITGPPRPPTTVLDRMAARGLTLLSATHAAAWYDDLFISNGGKTGRVECAKKSIKRAADVANQFGDKIGLKGVKRHISKKGGVPLWQMTYLSGFLSPNCRGLYYRVVGRGQQGALAIVDASRIDTIRAEMEAKLGALEVFEIMPGDGEPAPRSLVFPPTLVQDRKRPLRYPTQPSAPVMVLTLVPAPSPCAQPS